ncbi:MAG: RidA family protein [Gemmatimonadota bacterium]|nr:RidA family protein [Gemmatimonadota bacterium]
MTYEIINPEALGRPRGWNNGMLALEGGRVLFVAGQIGLGEGPGAGGVAREEAGAAPGTPGGAGAAAGDSEGAPDLAAQFGAALANVKRVVEGAGGAVADVGRLTVYVTDMEAYRGSRAEIGAEYRAVFGKHFPAMSLVAVTELVDPRAVVEIEATAVIP